MHEASTQPSRRFEHGKRKRRQADDRCQYRSAPAVARALDGLAARLRLAGGMPPVWIQPLPQGLSGLCFWDAHAEQEILLSPQPAGLEEPGADDLSRRARGMVLHELSHRLLQQAAQHMAVAADHAHGHNAAFLAVELLLFLRVGQQIGSDSPGGWVADLYDLHDHASDDLITPGQALGWAWKMAHEMAPTDAPAESCAQEILKKYMQWRAWLEDAPARARRQRLAQARADAAARAIKQRLMIAAASGWALAALLFWVR